VAIDPNLRMIDKNKNDNFKKVEEVSKLTKAQ